MTTNRKLKGGRAPTGTLLRTRDGRFQAQVTFRDGRRQRMDPFPPDMSEAMAREKMAVYAARSAETSPPPREQKSEAKAEIPDSPMGRWLTAWIADREARGLLSKRENTSHYLLAHRSQHRAEARSRLDERGPAQALQRARR
jgi:hypothetical protein